MPAGLLNCPSPLPALPHVVMSVPTSSNFCTRLLPRSVTYTWPAPSVVTQPGPWNWPSSLPCVPHSSTNVPQASVVVVVTPPPPPCLIVVVVVGVVLVVVGPAHSTPPHASQQLGAVPAHAVPPLGAEQRPEFLITQDR